MKITTTTTTKQLVTESRDRDLNISFLAQTEAEKPWAEACDRILTRVFERTEISPKQLLHALEAQGTTKFIVRPDAPEEPQARAHEGTIFLYVEPDEEPAESVRQTIDLLGRCVGAAERRKGIAVVESWGVNWGLIDKCAEAQDDPQLAESINNYHNAPEAKDDFRPAAAIRSYNKEAAARKASRQV